MTIQENVQLSEHLWYKIGGKAKYLIQVEKKQDVLEAFDFIHKNNITKTFICGLGSNLIFSDDYFDGAIIQFIHGKDEQISLTDTNTVEAFAGEVLGHVITYALDNNLTGLEFAGGLPGTVGAAVRGNVGAFGGETKDVVANADVLVIGDNGQMNIKTLTNQELQFVYRGSIVKDQKGKMLVLSAKYNLQKASTEETQKARKIFEKNIQFRKDRHPLEYPNCGSVFKNIREPEKIEKIKTVFPDIKEKIETQWYGKVAAGYLIQRIGLQGLRIGDAQISTKHALFIVNLGHAKAQDVLGVIDTIQNKFKETFGFTLEPEVEIVR